MANKLDIRDFDIDPSTIPPEIETLHNSLAKARKTKLKKNYVSAYDFLVILFHSTFVERLSVREIAERFHLHPVDIEIQLYNFGWDYSSDYVENQQLFKQAMAEASGFLIEAKEKSPLLKVTEFPMLQEALQKARNIREKSHMALGFATREEYVRVFYYLLYCLEMSPIVLCQLFNVTYQAMHRRLSVLGLNISHKEAMIRKKKYGRQDYVKSINTGNITKTRSQLKSYSQGSGNENYFRSQLAKMIYAYLGSRSYEVIVGLSNIGIIGREIDIPLVVYDVAKNVIHRIAIEYNAEHWHPYERDVEKEIMCESKGWYYLKVVEPRIANKPELLHPILHETCEKIKNIVLA